MLPLLLPTKDDVEKPGPNKTKLKLPILVCPLGTPNLTMLYANLPADPPLKLPAFAVAELSALKLCPEKLPPTDPFGVTANEFRVREETLLLKKKPLLALAWMV